MHIVQAVISGKEAKIELKGSQGNLRDERFPYRHVLYLGDCPEPRACHLAVVSSRNYEIFPW